MDDELFIKELIEANNVYFKKYFVNNDINTAIYSTFTEGLKILLKAYTKFLFLENGINTIKNNKKVWKSIDYDTKNDIKLFLKGVKMINENIKSILEPITNGMELE